MKTPFDPRHQARIVALQKLFESIYKDRSKSELSFHEIAQIGEVKEFDETLANKLVKGTLENLEKIDLIIAKYAKERPLDQVSKVDIQILRLAIFEGFIGKLTPPKVAIDEAVEMAKEFGGPNAGRFVNGVLGNLLKEENGK